MNLAALIITIIAFLIVTYVVLSLRFHIRMRFSLIYFFIASFILIVRGGIFVVNEGSQVVITQFGAIIGEPYTKAGLYFKIPFIWKVNYFDKRIFRESDYQTRIPTKDGYFIVLDEVFNWRINDPSLFIQTMSTMDKARTLIRNNLSGGIRQAVSANDLLSIIRSFNKTSPIATFLDSLRNQLPIDQLKKRQDFGGNSLLGMTIKVESGRSEIMSQIRRQSHDYLNQFGIEIVGVLIRNIKYDPSVEKRVYQRMYMERVREAERLRSSGRSEASRIKGQMKKKYQEITAPARMKALLIKGQAEATALKIQAQSFGQNEPFYNYWRMLRVYEESLPTMSQGIIFSMDSPLLKLINEGSSKVNGVNTKANELERK
jgi:membrane protease subunit HflC